MARQKSEATIERERDREIRRQRRALIKEERDRKRAIRAEKTRLRELVRNGDFVETATAGTGGTDGNTGRPENHVGN